MKKTIGLMSLTLLLAGASFAQTTTKPDGKKPPVVEIQDNSGRTRQTEPFQTADETKADTNGLIKRGAAIGSAKKVSLSKVLKNPNKFAGKTVQVEGVIVRSCKMEGCWMELAPSKDAKSVRVKMKDHAFFIPLDAAGMNAKAEGIVSIKTLSKAEVEHLMSEDGAKFDNINKDGTVTEVSFEATGVELNK